MCVYDALDNRYGFLNQFNLRLIAPLFTVSFHEMFEKKKVFKIFKSWHVCDWLAKWIIMLGFMEFSHGQASDWHRDGQTDAGNDNTRWPYRPRVKTQIYEFMN